MLSAAPGRTDPGHAQPDRPVVVAFLLQDFELGGISQWIYTVCAELHRTDPGRFAFHFICTHGWVIQERFARVGTPVFLGREGRAPNWLVWLRVQRYLQRLRPDIIQFSNLKPYRDLCYRVRPPVIIERKAAMRTVGRYDSRGVDAIISQNRQVMEALRDLPVPQFLVYHGVDLDGLASVVPNRAGFGPDDFIVGQVARLSPGKNQRMLIDVVARVRQRHPRVKLVLVGGATRQAGAVDLLPELREHARRLGVEAVFTGALNDPAPYIAGFNVGTCTTTRACGEGAPRLLIEPMAFGIPCVTTDAGATNEVIEDGVNGFLVPDDDVPGMADRIERLLLDEALYRRLSHRARETVERRFNIRTQARQVRDIFLSLLAQSTRPRSRRRMPEPISAH